MIDRLVQERCNSSALAMELRLSCINPLTWYLMIIYLQINTNLQWRRMIVMSSQITGNSTVCSINYLWLTSKKRSKLCPFVRGIHGWLVDFPNKWYRKHSHGISHSNFSPQNLKKRSTIVCSWVQDMDVFCWHMRYIPSLVSPVDIFYFYCNTACNKVEPNNNTISLTFILHTALQQQM